MQKRKSLIYFLLFASLVSLINCEKKQWGEKIPTDMKTTSVKEIINNFNKLKCKTVLIEGWIYKTFPADVFLYDVTGKIAIDEFRGETSLFKKKITYLFYPNELQKQKFVKMMGILDVSRKYPTGSLLFGASPTIVAIGIELK